MGAATLPLTLPHCLSSPHRNRLGADISCPSTVSFSVPAHKPRPHACVPHKRIRALPRGRLAEVVCVSPEISPTTGLAVSPLRPSKASPGFSGCE